MIIVGSDVNNKTCLYDNGFYTNSIRYRQLYIMYRKFYYIHFGYRFIIIYIIVIVLYKGGT